MNDNILNKNIDYMIQLQKESNKTFRNLQYRKRLIQDLLNWIIDNEDIIKGNENGNHQQKLKMALIK